LFEWKLEPDADGNLRRSGEKAFTFTLDDWPIDTLPWEHDRDLKFGDDERKAVLQVIQDLQAAYTRDDREAIAAFREPWFKQVGGGCPEAEAFCRDQQARMDTFMAEMRRKGDWKPLAFDPSSFSIERIEGFNLVFIRPIKNGRAAVGHTDGKQFTGMGRMFLSRVNGEWVRVW